MKKFHFRLQSILKLRMVREEQVKMELGRLNQEKTGILKEINHSRDSLDFIFKTQEESLAEGLDSRYILSMPNNLSGNRAKLKELKSNLESLEIKISEKVQQLAAAQGEVKVIEKLKDQAMLKFNKEKKRQELIVNEEQVRLWLNRKEA